MSNTLPICLKATDERFNTTFHERIECMCTHSTALSYTNADDYYMAINNSDMLDGNQTVEEIGSDPLNRFYSLDVCIKTRILAERILQSRMQLWQVLGKRVSQKEQQTITIKESTNIDMKRKMTVDLTVVNNLVFSHLI